MPTVTQKSFLGGIIGTASWALTDLARRAYGLVDCENFLNGRDGSLYNRSGTAIVAATKSNGVARYIAFRFGGTDTTMLELGAGYMRFDVAGVPVTHAAATAYSATASYAIADMVSSGGVNYYCIKPTIGNAPPNSTYWYPQTTTGGVSIYEIPTPWGANEVFYLRFDGFADVRFFVQPGRSGVSGRRMYQLKRIDATSGAPVWTLQSVSFLPSIEPPQNIQASSSGASVTRRYKVVAVKNKTLEPSFAGNGATVYTGIIDNTGAGGKLQVNATNTLVNNDDVLITRVYPGVAAKDADFEAKVLGKIWNVSGVTGTTFDLDNSTGIIAPVTGPTPYYYVEVTVLKSPVLKGLLDGGSTQNKPVLVNVTSHGLVTGDEIYFLTMDTGTFPGQADAGPFLVGKVWRVTRIDADNFHLNGSDGFTVSAANEAWFVKTEKTDDGGAAASAGSIVTLTWNAVDDAREYWVYKDATGAGLFGFIGKSILPTYIDDNDVGNSETVPITSDVPIGFVDPTQNNYPAAVAVLQERLVLAGGLGEPTRCRASRTGNLLSFTQGSPLADGDALDFSLRGLTVESIYHALALNGQLMLFTSGDVWLAGGDADGLIRPDALNLKPTAAYGTTDLRPLRVGMSAIFVDQLQARVRDIGLTQYGGYADTDLSQYAPNLVQGHSLSDWDWQQSPDSQVFAAREDGQGLVLTFVREDGTFAWARITTETLAGQSSYESFAVAHDAGGLYLNAIVKRTINNSTARFKERFYLRNIGLDTYSIVSHAHFLDCEYSYDGTADGSTHLAITTLTDYLAGSTLTVTASTVPAGTTIFNSWDVGNRLVITSGANTITITITGYTSPTVVTGTATVNVPAALQAGAGSLTWTRYYHKIGGLSLLEGEHLAALGDGEDVTVNQTALVTVSSGVTTLTGYYIKVRAGLPITAEAETIGLDQGQLPMSPATAPQVGMLVTQSKGWKVGPDADNLVGYTPSTGAPLEDGWMIHSNRTFAKRHGGGLVLSQKAPLPVCFHAAMQDVRTAGNVGGGSK